MEWSHDIGWHRILETPKLKKPTLRKEGSERSVCQMISVSGHSTHQALQSWELCANICAAKRPTFSGLQIKPQNRGWWVGCWCVDGCHQTWQAQAGSLPLHFSPYNPQFLMYVSDCAKVSVVGSSYNLIACGINHLRNNPAIACWSRRTTWLGQKKLAAKVRTRRWFPRFERNRIQVWKNTACQEIFWQTWTVATKSCGVAPKSGLNWSLLTWLHLGLQRFPVTLRKLRRPHTIWRARNHWEPQFRH